MTKSTIEAIIQAIVTIIVTISVIYMLFTGVCYAQMEPDVHTKAGAIHSTEGVTAGSMHSTEGVTAGQFEHDEHTKADMNPGF